MYHVSAITYSNTIYVLINNKLYDFSGGQQNIGTYSALLRIIIVATCPLYVSVQGHRYQPCSMGIPLLSESTRIRVLVNQLQVNNGKVRLTSACVAGLLNTSPTHKKDFSLVGEVMKQGMKQHS